jgi:hypothetical protein
MSPVLVLLSILFIGVFVLLAVGVVAWVRSGARPAKLEARRYRQAFNHAEKTLRSIANGSADPVNEASIALYDIEASLYKELEN